MLKHMTRVGQPSAVSGAGNNNNDSCKDLVPYNENLASKRAAGSASDSDESTLVLVVNTDTSEGEDTGVFVNVKAPEWNRRTPEPPEVDSLSGDTESQATTIEDIATDVAGGEVSDSSIDVVSVDPPKFPVKQTPRKQQVVTSTSTNTPKRMSLPEKLHSTTPGPANRKRKSLSPARPPEPTAKQPRLNKTITVVDYHEIDSEDDRKQPRGRKPKQFGDTPPPGPASSKPIDQNFLHQLLADQSKHPPQHEAGKCQEFRADEQRLKYFEQVLHLKLHKYWNLPALYFRHNNKTLHLASPFPQFVEAYWPGQVMCCNIERNNVLSLERHIQRLHKPPKEFPKFSLIPLPGGSSESDTESVVPVSAEETSSPEKSKSPPGFLSDQLKFPPQHKPGEPEDFLANQESIDYFVEAMTLKRDKYSNMIPLKDKPLSAAHSDFVQYYWPGIVSCCDKIQLTCKEYQKHVMSCHLPPKSGPRPTVTNAEAVEAAKAAPRTPAAAATATVASRSESSPQLTSPRFQQRRRGQSGDPSATHQALPNEPPTINSPFMDEARKLRAQAAVSASLNELLPILERILDMMIAITMRMRSYVVCTSPDPTIRAHTIECLEFIWSSSKSAIVRWDELKGRTDAALLRAVQYVYGSLPVFVNWEDTRHLDMVESVVLSSKCTVRYCPTINQQWTDSVTALTYGLDPSATARAVVAAGLRRRSSLSVPSPAMRRLRRDSCSSTSSESPASQSTAVAELCRLANVAVWQNTRARPEHKDDDGNYHAMYRYGFKKMLDLYFPADVNQLKCCGKTFTDRPSLVCHVAERHESGAAGRTEPTISPV